jgi:hypothetical protein
MHLVRRAVVGACVTVTALGVVGVSPAAAYDRPTHRQVVASLLTSDQLPDRWHRTTYSDGSGVSLSGCGSTGSRRAADSADRSFQYGQLALLVDESVMTYDTLRAARLDVRHGIDSLAGCDDLEVAGHPWTVQRLHMPTIGDQQALFELKGFISTPSGDVPVTMWLGVARVGHHVASTLFTVGGALPDEDLTDVRDGGRGILAKAMRKVTNKLGV